MFMSLQGKVLFTDAGINFLSTVAGRKGLRCAPTMSIPVITLQESRNEENTHFISEVLAHKVFIFIIFLYLEADIKFNDHHHT